MSETDQSDTKFDKLITKVSNDTDTPEGEIRQLVSEKYELYKDSQRSQKSDDDLKHYSIKSVYNDLQNMESLTEELPILTLGYQERDGDHFVTTDGHRALVGLGIVSPEEDRPGLSVFVIDEADGIDIDYVKELFEPLNTIKGAVQRRLVGSRDIEEKLTKGDQPVYECETIDGSTFEEVDPEEDERFDGLPSEWEAKRDLINEGLIDEREQVTFQNYAQHVSVKQVNGFDVAFGADVKRIEGEIVNVYSNENFGVMTILDKSAFGPNDVPDDLIDDQMRTPGLKVWMAPDLLKYAEGSIVDVYGHIQQTDDGQYQMRGFGIIPIVEFERDTSTASSDDDIEEEMI